MKLSLPASSSDLDIARSIARRLSRLASPGDVEEAPLPPYTPLTAARPAAPPPLANHGTVRVSRPVAAEPAPPPAVSKPAPAPQPPPPAPPPPPVEEEVGVLTEEEPPPPPRPAPRPVPPPKIAPTPKAAPARPAPPPPPPLPPPPPPLEELEPEVPEPTMEPEADLAPDTEAIPDMEEDFEAAAREAAEAVPDPEPVLEEAPRPWAEVLQDCLYLAHASGALLIDAQGEVAAWTGEWPAPGVDHIAARLVPAMDKALKQAPHRSVSVPIGSLHLTAWRVHGSDTMVTVGFVAEAPLKAEVRPAIDAEVKRGLPA